MTQNTKTILLTIFACLLLITGFEIGAGRIRFGNAYFNDSTPSLVALNKGILVNGKLSTSNYAGLNNGVRFADTDIYIDDDGLDLRYSVETNGSHIFSTKSLTTLMTVDSANGMSVYLPGFSNVGRGRIRTKVVDSSLSGVTPGVTYMSIPHGITNYRNIISFDMMVYEDSVGAWYPPGYNRAGGLSPGNIFEIEGANCRWFIPAVAGNLKNAGDTVRFTIRYTE